MNKVFGIIASDFSQLMDTINKFNSNYDTFASNIFPDFQNKVWYAVLHYHTSKEDAVKPKEEGIVSTSKSIQSPTSIIQPTDKQIAFLKKNNWEGDLPKTKKEATLIIKGYINNLKGENI